MMRLRFRTGRGALFLAMFAVALVAFLPLRLALGWAGLAEQGLTARSVGGTMWGGSLRGARFGEVALGDLSAGVAPLPLVAGRARIGVRSLGAGGVTGSLVVARHRVGIDSIDAALPAGAAFAPLPITAVDLTGVTVQFVDGRCDRAEGRVRATLAPVALPLPSALAGAARCDGGALLLPMTAGPSEVATVRLWQDGRYRAELSIPAGDAADTAALQAAGFIAMDGGWRLSIEGRF